MARYPELNRVMEQMSHAVRQKEFDAALRILRDTQLLVGSAPLEHRQQVRDALSGLEPSVLMSIFGALVDATDDGNRIEADRLLSVMREAVGSVRSVSLRTEYRGRLRNIEDRVRDLPLPSAAPVVPDFASPVEEKAPVRERPTSVSEPPATVAPITPRAADPVLAARRSQVIVKRAAANHPLVHLPGGTRTALPVVRGAYPFPRSLHGEDELERWLERHGAPSTRHGVIRLLAMAGLRLPTAAEFAAMPRNARPSAPAWIRDDRHRLWLPDARKPGFPREATSRRVAIVAVSAATSRVVGSAR